jgi:hypothetical protein
MRDARRHALIAFGTVFVLGVAGLVVAAALDDRRLSFTLGVQPTQVAAVLDPGEVACQGPIDVPASARTVKFPVDTFGAPGPALEVLTPAGESGGRASVPAGYRGHTTVSASPNGIVAGRRIGLCVGNAGKRKVALYGGAPQASRTSRLMLNGRDTGTDLTLVFDRAEQRSFLSALGDVFDRAALFHPSWVGAGLLWVLAGLLVLALPAALGAALSGAAAGRVDPDARDRKADAPAGR